jgi:hypothetical protein
MKTFFGWLLICTAPLMVFVVAAAKTVGLI